MKKLFLLDAYALIFRSYYAFINRPIKNSKGLNTSAIFGFTNTLDEILRKENPDYIAVVFDPSGPTFRNELYPEYKANRLKTPEEIKASIPYIKKILNGFNIPVIEIEGYEADDVIGTLAKEAEQKGFKVYMMTPDKDYAQLVSNNIFMYKPSRQDKGVEIWGIPEVLKNFNVNQPGQVVDVLALWGDTSDNVPGATGIGEKTAKELIGKYHNIENLIRSVSELKGKQKENIQNNVDKIRLSKQLVTLNTNVPVNIDIEQLKKNNPDTKKLKEIFNELEFKTLSQRILNENKIPEYEQGSLFPVETKEDKENQQIYFKSLKDIPHKYYLIDNEQELKRIINSLLNNDEICFDTETTSLDVFKAELVGMSFSVKPYEAWYITFPTDRVQTLKWLEIIKPLLTNEKIKKIGQNIKYDIQVLKQYSVEVLGKVFDTMIAHYLIQPELKHSMDYLAEIYLKYKPVSIEELIGKKGKNQLSMRDVNIETIKEYAAEDADITLQLSKILSEELKKHELEKLALEIEMPLVKVLSDMEQIGVNININELNKYAEILKNELNIIQEDIYKTAGKSFNIASPKQLGEILFEHLRISVNLQKTKSEQYPTGEEVLLKIKDKHPIISKILDFRTIQKLLNTYVETLPTLVNPLTGRIHTSFEQAWVSTGRLSSKNPNLQNIPIRDERGREIRKAFIPADENHVLLSADYSQIELRIMAHLCEDENMIEAFMKNQDIHTSTAAKIYNISIEKVTREMRSRAKTANFGIIYGISAFGLAQRLNISRQEASKLIEGYFITYPKVKEYMNKNIEFAKSQGYVKTIMGRRRYLPQINSANTMVRGMAERNAINAPIQGSAADIIKLAMVRIHQKIKDNFKSKMILQVHDELVFDVFKPELEKMREIVKYEMENAVSLKVPLVVDIGIGNNWLEAH
jgi:DNA polymerase-1